MVLLLLEVERERLMARQLGGSLSIFQSDQQHSVIEYLVKLDFIEPPCSII